MKYLHWLFVSMAVVLCLCLAAPMNSEAASAKKASSHKTLQKKAARERHLEARNQKVKKERSKSKKSGLTAEKKGGKAKSQDAEREIWLNRAKNSDALSGIASWFGKDFHNKKTASGLDYDMYTFTAAHRTLPLGTVVKVTDAANGKSVMVCVTDRGPFVRGRIIDVSYAAAKRLGLNTRGIGKVKLEVVSNEKGEPLKAGQAYFVRYAAGNGKNKVGPFDGFADAAAMQEALSQAHPEAEVIMESAGGKH